MACTQVAMEKVFQKHEHGDPIPLGWALDKDGNDTTSAQAALESRLMLPFGGYKAIGLALAHEVMTSALMGGELFGGDSTGFIPFSGTLNASQYVSAINIDWFTPVETFKASVDEISRTVKASKLRPGVERVYMPGEKGYLEEKKRLAEGIPLTRKVIRQLQGWAVELGVPPLDV
jgi:LDH2 family malate/lactate/ureidoglycolate dehydrogenase